MEYGPPREMLAANGRQRTNWRGTTKFEKELKKDGAKHIRSRPHHPMTLGKIERFWKTILEEFLYQMRLDGLEKARERMGLWIKRCNHKPRRKLKNKNACRVFSAENKIKFDKRTRKEVYERVRQTSWTFAVSSTRM